MLIKKKCNLKTGRLQTMNFDKQLLGKFVHV